MSWPLWVFWGLFLYTLVELARLLYLDARAREIGDVLNNETRHIPCEDCHDV
jgi:hypothetical protein